MWRLQDVRGLLCCSQILSITGHRAAWTLVCSVFCVPPPHLHTLLVLIGGAAHGGYFLLPRSPIPTWKASRICRIHFSPSFHRGWSWRLLAGILSHALTPPYTALIHADFGPCLQNQPLGWDSHRDGWTADLSGKNHPGPERLLTVPTSPFVTRLNI